VVLLNFLVDGKLTVGIKTDAGIIDINAAAKVKNLAFDCPCGCGTKFGTVDPLTMEAICWCGKYALNYIAEVTEGAPVLVEEELTFAPVVTQPEKILCVGVNYLDHAMEGSGKLPDFPVLFNKFNTALAAHNEVIPIMEAAGNIDYEAELVVVMGKTCFNVSKEEVDDYIFGYTIGNDISAREQQRRVSQWLTGKSPDKFGPVGPYIVTKDEVDGGNIDVTLYRNGEVKQHSNTDKLIFDIGDIISYTSKFITLKPGDIIFTGTMAGVIGGTADKNWLKAGDEIVIEIEGIGKLRNVIG